MRVARAMATVMRVVGNEEGDGGKSGGNGDNGGRRAMAMATKRVMVTVTRVGDVGGRQNGQWQ